MQGTCDSVTTHLMNRGPGTSTSVWGTHGQAKASTDLRVSERLLLHWFPKQKGREIFYKDR